jgi:hypothetical protein
MMLLRGPSSPREGRHDKADGPGGRPHFYLPPGPAGASNGVVGFISSVRRLTA